MKKPNKESILIAGYISGFLDGYVLSQKTDSMNTLKSYRDAIVLYLSFLENEKKIHSDSLNADCFRHTVIEEWLVWLRESRGCSPESCNNRLGIFKDIFEVPGAPGKWS